MQAIEQYWQGEDQNGRSLSDSQRQDLKKLTEGCKEVLLDIQILLNKHQNVGKSPSIIARIKWAPKDVGLIRNRLMFRTTLLATFNNTITAQARGFSQQRNEAALLEALNRIHRDFEQGARATTAISQATLERLKDDENQAWESIAAEIQREGVSLEALKSNRTFIQNWIDKVILEDVGECDEREIPSRRSTSTFPPDSLAVGLGSLNLEVDNEQSLRASDTEYALQRRQSSSSHSSQESTWRPLDGPNREYVQILLAKLFQQAKLLQQKMLLQVEHQALPRDDRKILLLAKRIYHQLDWCDRGFLFRFMFEEEFRLAIQSVGFCMPDDWLNSLVASSDKNKDGVIDRMEFISLACHVVDTLASISVTSFEEDIQRSTEDGLSLCKKSLGKQYGILDRRVLPQGWYWQDPSSPGGPAIHTLEDGEPNENPSLDLETQSFTVMAIATGRILIPFLVRKLNSWASQLQTLSREIFVEYQDPMNIVVSAASILLELEDETVNHAHPHRLDKVMTITALLDMDDFETSEKDSLTSMYTFRSNLHRLFGMVAGFIHKLNDLELPRDQAIPPLDAWRQLHMGIRAHRIQQEALSLGNVQDKLGQCVAWYNQNATFFGTLTSRAAAALKVTTSLRINQLKHQPKVRLSHLTTQEVEISISGARNLPKDGSSLPQAYATLTCDAIPNPTALFEENGVYSARTRTCNSSDPVWEGVAIWNDFNIFRNPYIKVHPDSYFTVTVHSIQKGTPPRRFSLTRRHESHEPATTMIGSQRFRLRDNVDLFLPRSQQFKLDLGSDGSKGCVQLTVKPRCIDPILWMANPPPRSVQQSMEVINKCQLPPAWERKRTPDGRTYFINTSIGLKTIACHL
ncbi:MAG: hypothetical protein M1820_004419 [Bogoriella megaspora]|nr:MAG: hypothetical protein M1820_004419 [Bogoriella megaspora]